MWSGPVLIKPGRLLWSASVVFALFSIYYAWPVPPEIDTNPFRAARDVPRAEREQVTRACKLKLLAHWAEHNQSCGVAGPDIGIYTNYMLRKHGDGVEELFNVRVLPFPNASLLTTEEESPLCKKSRTIERYSRVWIIYDTSNEDAMMALIEDPLEAACIQHFDDLLKGIWPC